MAGLHEPLHGLHGGVGFGRFFAGEGQGPAAEWVGRVRGDDDFAGVEGAEGEVGVDGALGRGGGRGGVEF